MSELTEKQEREIKRLRYFEAHRAKPVEAAPVSKGGGGMKIGPILGIAALGVGAWYLFSQRGDSSAGAMGSGGLGGETGYVVGGVGPMGGASASQPAGTINYNISLPNVPSSFFQGPEAGGVVSKKSEAAVVAAYQASVASGGARAPIAVPQPDKQFLAQAQGGKIQFSDVPTKKAAQVGPWVPVK
jgi:hypothetical protein